MENNVNKNLNKTDFQFNNKTKTKSSKGVVSEASSNNIDPIQDDLEIEKGEDNEIIKEEETPDSYIDEDSEEVYLNTEEMINEQLKNMKPIYTNDYELNFNKNLVIDKIERRKKKYFSNREINQMDRNTSKFTSIKKQEEKIQFKKIKSSLSIKSGLFKKEDNVMKLEEDNDVAIKSLLFCSKSNKIRSKIYYIVNNYLFDYIFLLNVLLHTIIMIIVYENNGSNKAMMYLDFYFFFIYFLEFFLKSIAFGCYEGKRSYFKDPWLKFNFILLILNFIMLLPYVYTQLEQKFNIPCYKLDINCYYNLYNYRPIANRLSLKDLRVFIYFRPLKIIAFIPTLKSQVELIGNSIQRLLKFLSLLFFFYFLFGVFGNLVWSGLLFSRCREGIFPSNGDWKIRDINEPLCGGYYSCSGDATCGSISYTYDKGFFFFNPLLNLYSERKIDALNYGISNFDNILYSILTVFQTSTLNGWSKIMYMYQNGYNFVSAFIYFFLIIVIINYFILNFTIGIMMDSSRAIHNSYTKEEERQRKLENKEFNIFKEIILKENISVRNFKFLEFLKFELKNSILFNFKVEPYYSFHQKYNTSYICYIIEKQNIFHYSIFILKFINLLLLSQIESNKSDKFLQNIYKANMVINCFLLFFEVIIMTSTKLTFYFNNNKNIYFLFIYLGVIGEYTINKTCSTTSLYCVEIIYIMKYFKKWRTAGLIIKCFAATVYEMGNYMILIFINILCFALVGRQLFRNRLKFNSSGEFDIINGLTADNNFDTFFDSIISTFIIFVGEDWNQLFLSCLKSDFISKVYVYIYFVTAMIFLNIIMMNLVLAFLVYHYQKIRKRFLKRTEFSSILQALKENYIKRSFSFSKKYNNYLKQAFNTRNTDFFFDSKPKKLKSSSNMNNYKEKFKQLLLIEKKRKERTKASDTISNDTSERNIKNKNFNNYDEGRVWNIPTNNNLAEKFSLDKPFERESSSNMNNYSNFNNMLLNNSNFTNKMPSYAPSHKISSVSPNHIDSNRKNSFYNNNKASSNNLSNIIYNNSYKSLSQLNSNNKNQFFNRNSLTNSNSNSQSIANSSGSNNYSSNQSNSNPSQVNYTNYYSSMNNISNVNFLSSNYFIKNEMGNEKRKSFNHRLSRFQSPIFLQKNFSKISEEDKEGEHTLNNSNDSIKKSADIHRNSGYVFNNIFNFSHSITNTIISKSKRDSLSCSNKEMKIQSNSNNEDNIRFREKKINQSSQISLFINRSVSTQSIKKNSIGSIRNDSNLNNLATSTNYGGFNNLNNINNLNNNKSNLVKIVENKNSSSSIIHEPSKTSNNSSKTSRKPNSKANNTLNIEVIEKPNDNGIKSKSHKASYEKKGTNGQKETEMNIQQIQNLNKMRKLKINYINNTKNNCIDVNSYNDFNDISDNSRTLMNHKSCLNIFNGNFFEDSDDYYKYNGSKRMANNSKISSKTQKNIDKYSIDDFNKLKNVDGEDIFNRTLDKNFQKDLKNTEAYKNEKEFKAKDKEQNNNFHSSSKTSINRIFSNNTLNNSNRLDRDNQTKALIKDINTNNISIRNVNRQADGISNVSTNFNMQNMHNANIINNSISIDNSKGILLSPKQNSYVSLINKSKNSSNVSLPVPNDSILNRKVNSNNNLIHQSKNNLFSINIESPNYINKSVMIVTPTKSEISDNKKKSSLRKSPILNKFGLKRNTIDIKTNFINSNVKKNDKDKDNKHVIFINNFLEEENMFNNNNNKNDDETNKSKIDKRKALDESTLFKKSFKHTKSLKSMKSRKSLKVNNTNNGTMNLNLNKTFNKTKSIVDKNYNFSQYLQTNKFRNSVIGEIYKKSSIKYENTINLILYVINKIDNSLCFRIFVYITIILGISNLVIFSEQLNHNEENNKAAIYFDYSITWIFTFEILIKIISRGLWKKRIKVIPIEAKIQAPSLNSKPKPRKSIYFINNENKENKQSNNSDNINNNDNNKNGINSNNIESNNLNMLNKTMNRRSVFNFNFNYTNPNYNINNLESIDKSVDEDEKVVPAFSNNIAHYMNLPNPLIRKISAQTNNSYNKYRKLFNTTSANSVFTIEPTVVKAPFLTNIINVIDLIVVITNLIHFFYMITAKTPEVDALIDKHFYKKSMNSLVSLKGFRILIVVQDITPLFIIGKCVIKSIPIIASMFLVGITFIFTFALITTSYFKGILGTCDLALSRDRKSDLIWDLKYFNYSSPQTSLNMNKIDNTTNLDFYYYYDQVLFPNTKDEVYPVYFNTTARLNSTTINKNDCDKIGGIWTRSTFNFDNLSNALIVLFETATLEGWVELMNNIVRGKNTISAVFFIIYIIITCIFIMNLSVCAVVDNFISINEGKDGIDDIEETHLSWLRLIKIFLKRKPTKTLQISEQTKENVIYKIITNKFFTQFINVIIVINSINYLAVVDRSTVLYEDIQSYIFYASAFIFNFEALFKLIIYRKSYFLQAWNVYDFAVILLGNTSILLNLVYYYVKSNFEIKFSDFQITPVLIRGLRIFMYFRIVKLSKNIREYLNIMIHMLRSMIYNGILVLLNLFIYTILGKVMFANLMHYTYITGNTNFSTIIHSFMLLVRCNTGEDWQKIMHEAATRNEGCYDYQSQEHLKQYGNLGCGSYISYPYFVSFIILNYLIFMNLFIAVIVDSFLTNDIDSVVKRIDDDIIDSFYNNWSLYDTNSSLIIEANKLPLILYNLSDSLGINMQPFKDKYNCLKDEPKNINFNYELSNYHCMLIMDKFNITCVDGKVHIIDVIRLIVGLYQRKFSFKDAYYLEIFGSNAIKSHIFKIYKDYCKMYLENFYFNDIGRIQCSDYYARKVIYSFIVRKIRYKIFNGKIRLRK